MPHEEYMKEAIRLSVESVIEGGGPFGAVIVDSKTGIIIGKGKNRVTLHNDPTAHGEVEAIRDAGKNVGGVDFSDCVLYTSAEPCPGCLTEILFNAGIKTIFYGNNVVDAAEIGFADDKNWNLIDLDAEKIVQKVGGTITQMMRDEAQEGFVLWKEKENKVEYYKA